MPAKYYERKDIENLLFQLSKELKKEFGRKAKFEIIVVGGASVLFNYDFRKSTTDIDGFLSNSYSIKDAIRRVADNNGISAEWLNSDFVNTESYSTKLLVYSKPYKTFNQVLSIRTVKDEYLIAMKLMSGRLYKNDFSDICGILNENQNLDEKSVLQAFQNLYGDKRIPSAAWTKFKEILHSEKTYEEIEREEKINHDIVINLQASQHKLTEEVVQDVLANTPRTSLDELIKAAKADHEKLEQPEPSNKNKEYER